MTANGSFPKSPTSTDLSQFAAEFRRVEARIRDDARLATDAKALQRHLQDMCAVGARIYFAVHDAALLAKTDDVRIVFASETAAPGAVRLCAPRSNPDAPDEESQLLWMAWEQIVTYVTLMKPHGLKSRYTFGAVNVQHPKPAVRLLEQPDDDLGTVRVRALDHADLCRFLAELLEVEEVVGFQGVCHEWLDYAGNAVESIDAGSPTATLAGLESNSDWEATREQAAESKRRNDFASQTDLIVRRMDNDSDKRTIWMVHDAIAAWWAGMVPDQAEIKQQFRHAITAVRTASETKNLTKSQVPSKQASLPPAPNGGNAIPPLKTSRRFLSKMALVQAAPVVRPQLSSVAVRTLEQIQRQLEQWQIVVPIILADSYYHRAGNPVTPPNMPTANDVFAPNRFFSHGLASFLVESERLWRNLVMYTPEDPNLDWQKQQQQVMRLHQILGRAEECLGLPSIGSTPGWTSWVSRLFYLQWGSPSGFLSDRVALVNVPSDDGGTS